jgi:putative ABC transport system permease protein
MNPDWKQIVRTHLAALCLPPARELEIVEEVALHLEAIYDEALLEGLPEAEAQQRAVQSYDWRLLECELSRVEQSSLSHWLPAENQRGGIRMESLFQDLRYGARMLLKQPGFTLIAVITLGLGIGANTAIFSIVNAVLLRPLPYLDAARFVVIESGDRSKGVEKYGGVAPANFWDYQTQQQSFTHLVAISGMPLTIGGDQPETVPGSVVTTNYFAALNVQPLLGRTFNESDGCFQCPTVILLSYKLWVRRFGANPQIVGQKLPASNVEVIGVMPPDFKYPTNLDEVIWQPMAKDSSEMANRANRYFGMYGLLKPGVTMEQAQTELQAITARLEARYPKENKNLGIAVHPFRARLVREVKSSLLILLGAVGFVLLIACANVANLLLAKAAGRQRELAIRAALGAGRGRLLRQLLLESLLLAVAGSAAGLLLAWWARAGLLALLPKEYSYLRLDDQLQLDWRVQLFAAGIALLTALLAGLLPALQASRSALNEFLKDGARGAGGVRGHRTRHALVVVEIALAMMLVIGASLLLTSFRQLQRVDLGFAPQGLFTVAPSVAMNKYRDNNSRVQFIQQLQEAVGRAPGVEGVALQTGVTFAYLNFPINFPQRPLAVEETALYDAISPNYFRVMQGRVLRGREFADTDKGASPPVAIINEQLARRYFDGVEPLGQTITLNYLGQPQQREIVGVVADLHQGELRTVKPQVYVPMAQQPWFSAALLIRSNVPVAQAGKEAQLALRAADATQPMATVRGLEEELGAKLAEPRFYAYLLGLFALLALLLAALGVYGVMAWSVSQRTSEIGIRLALGAQPRDVLSLVIKQGMRLIVLGIGCGLVGAWAVTRALNSLLFGISATDAWTFIGVALVLLGVAVLACWLPARRAARVDPLVALRSE